MEKITQAEFIDAVSNNTNQAQWVVKAVLHEAAKAIVGYAKNGISVPFPGPGDFAGCLGKFSPHDAPERMGRNPKTGETHRIPAKRVLKFKVSATVDLNK